MNFSFFGAAGRRQPPVAVPRMFSTQAIDNRHHQALSSLYTGFLTVDEPISYSYASSCPPDVRDNLLSCLSNLTPVVRNSDCSRRSPYASHAVTGKGLQSILRSLSLGSYIWAPMPCGDNLDEGVATNESNEAGQILHNHTIDTLYGHHYT